MAISENRPFGMASPVPGIDPGIGGAPVTVPGGGSDKPTTRMSGTPVATATVPAAVSVDLEGAPKAGLSVVNPAVKVSTDVKTEGAEEKKEVPTTAPPLAAEVTMRNNPDTAGSDRKIRTLQDMIDRLAPQESATRRKRRERVERSAKLISAVSDGLSALGNLYYTSQYAPNMYNHEKGSQLTAQNAAIEKARKDREANADRYLRFALALGDAENERARTTRELEAERERRKLAREKAQRDAEAHGWLAALQPEKQREQAGKADKAAQEARTAQAEADNAPAMQKAKLDTEKARKGSYEASAGASRASAANSYASAASHNRANRNEFTAYDEKGRAFNFRTADAAEAFARQHGTWHETDETETTKTETRRNPKSQPQTRTGTKTKKGGYAGKPSPTGGKKSPTA